MKSECEQVQPKRASESFLLIKNVSGVEDCSCQVSFLRCTKNEWNIILDLSKVTNIKLYI